MRKNDFAKTAAKSLKRRSISPLLPIIFGCILSVAHAELIPAARLVDWTPGVVTGVPGGIPTRTNLIDVTKAPYNADTSGAADSSAAIQLAVNAASPNDVVYLPTGTYLFNGPVAVKSFVTVRGAGISNTIVKFTLPYYSAFKIGSSADYAWNYPAAPDNAIVSGYSKGSTSLVFAKTDPSWLGKLCFVNEKNDSSQPVVSVVGYERLKKQMVRVTAVSGNNVTIFPPLYWTMDASRSPAFAMATQDGKFAGVEDMTIDWSGSLSAAGGVAIQEGYGSWIKNIKMSRCKNYGLSVSDSLQCEVRGCWVDRTQDPQSSNHAGLLFASSSGCLIEDNILDDVFPCIEINFGSSGNVFAYNFISSSQWGGALNANHGPHNHHNLFEGNAVFSIQSDGYFGSSSEDTLLRNWVHGIYVGGGADGQSAGLTVLKLNRFNRNASMIGNLFGNSLSNLTYEGLLSLGKPNIGNEGWTGYGPPWKVT